METSVANLLLMYLILVFLSILGNGIQCKYQTSERSVLRNVMTTDVQHVK